MVEQHVLTDLSAYLDDELATERRAAVAAHLRGCAACERRLAELRSTASLIGALPAARPTRDLVPRVRGTYAWLRPLRSLSAVATGAFVLLFIASATLESGSRFGGGGKGIFTTSARDGAAAPAALPAPQGAPGGGPQSPSGPAGAGGLASTAAPAKELAPTLQAPAAAQRSVASAVPAPSANADAARSQDAARARSDEAARAEYLVEPLRVGPSPWLWLGLALLAAALALGAHRRLRAR